MQRLMDDSRLNLAERPLQPPFSFANLFSGLAMFGIALAAVALLQRLPDQPTLPQRTVALSLEPVALGRPGSPLRLVGAWRLTAPDPRFGGFSGLAVDQGALLALTDSGAVARIELGRRRVTLRDLPAVPGNPARKRGRDSEALVRDPAGRGWWVAFEQQHVAFLYDAGFSERLGQIWFRSTGWRANRGVEALAALGTDRWAVTETGQVIRFGPRGAHTLVWRLPAGISDAAALPDGRILLLQRRASWRGFDSRLLVARQIGGEVRIVARALLSNAPLDNLEAIATAPLPDGGTRLWIMTDDNFRPWMRTLLVAIDLPAERAPA